MQQGDFMSFLKKLGSESVKVLDIGKDDPKFVQLDLSVHNEQLKRVDLNSASSIQAYITDYLSKNEADIAFGGYLEHRGIYRRSEHFNSIADPNNERSIHLGIDLWCEADTPVKVCHDGKVHSQQYNDAYGDYGPTIIIEHESPFGKWYSLYGHLSLNSLDLNEPGVSLRKGDVIGYLGTAEVNGDYAPHLHFQLISSIGEYRGDFPGVCAINQLEEFKVNCPDPNLLLQL